MVVLSQQPPQIPLVVVPGVGDLCGMGNCPERRDHLGDVRFPYGVCLGCRALWCRIERCSRQFHYMPELMKHQKTCHQYPIARKLACDCHRPREMRTNFWGSCEECTRTNCTNILCVRNGCHRVSKDQATHNAHEAQDHSNPHDCPGCGTINVRTRETQVDTLQCVTCPNTVWCLRGYCEWTGPIANLPVHQVDCTFDRQ